MARPFRYTLILATVALGTALAAVGGWRFARASAPLSGPIIVISIDTLRADHLPAYGYEKVKTPAISALAADGVVFERAYSHTPQTLPAHAALLSGRLPFETGVRDDTGFAVRPAERLLPELLRDRGYATAAVVSSYLLRKETGIGQGFDFFDAEMPSSSPEVPFSQVQRDGGDSAAIAERWLDTTGTSRAFLFLHLHEPHAPYAAPERFSMYSPYDAEIAYADEIVGRLVHFLKSHQLYDRSTIILLADHGEGLGDHGEQEHGLFLYDEAVHVPLIIKQESNARAGHRVADLVQHVDLVPTILDLVKAPIPGNLRGRSLKPLLDGDGRLPARMVYAEALYGRYHFGWAELTATTDGRFRLIKAPRAELYDLERDPEERANLIAQDTGVLQADDPEEKAQKALGRALETLVGRIGVDPPGEASLEARERLEALGYIGGPFDISEAVSGARPDPKDKADVLETYRRAIGQAGLGKWLQAIGLLQQLLRGHPETDRARNQLAVLATRIDRHELALNVYKQSIGLNPSDAAAHIGAGSAALRLRKLDEAAEHAELAAALAGADHARLRASAHTLLARIALARRDPDAAREHAGLARQADPALPLPVYVEARLFYDQGNYADALPLFERAIAEIESSGGPAAVDWHYYTADTLARLDRFADAEAQFVEEIRLFPYNSSARTGLATVYHATGRIDEAVETLAVLVRVTPTPDAYALAARLLASFGKPQDAARLRAEARKAFARASSAG